MNVRKLLLAAGIAFGVAGLLLAEVGVVIFAHAHGLVVLLFTLGGVSGVNSLACAQLLEYKKGEEERKRKNNLNYHG